MRPIDADYLKAGFEEDGHLSPYVEQFIDACPTLKSQQMWTIEDIKKALVEVRDICKGRRCCTEPELCPFLNTEVGGCAIDGFFPHKWLVDGWKEDSNG